MVSNKLRGPVANRIGSGSGCWAMLEGGMLVSRGMTADEAQVAARTQGANSEGVLVYLEESGRCVPERPELALEVSKCLEQGVVSGTWIVGGAIRDIILGRDVADIDFVVDGDAIGAARRVAAAVRGDFYVLDNDRETARIIVIRDNRSLRLDFARMRGESLAEDLLARDFTINAMAMPVAGEQYVLDPAGGWEDLDDRKVKAVTSYCLLDDPVRCVRAVRIAAELGFKVDLATERLITDAAPGVALVSAERLRDEIMACLACANPSDAMRALADLGVIGHMLPGASDPRHKIADGADVDGHSWKGIVEIIEWLHLLFSRMRRNYSGCNDIGRSLSELISDMQSVSNSLLTRIDHEMVEGRTRYHLMLLSILLGVISDEDDTHSGEGTDRQDERARHGGNCATSMRLSKREVNYVARLCGRSEKLNKICHKQRMTSLDVHRFFRDVGDAGVELCLVELAHLAVNSGCVKQQCALPKHSTRLVELIRTFFLERENVIRPQPLLNGEDVMTILQVVRGPIVGKALRLLMEAQVSGEITTRKQAMDRLPSLMNGATKYGSKVSKI